MSAIPEGLDPAITSREIVFEADVASVTPFLKLATVSRNGAGHMFVRMRRRAEARWPGVGAHPADVLQAALAF
jgi:hypothetical protein